LILWVELWVLRAFGKSLNINWFTVEPADAASKCAPLKRERHVQGPAAIAAAFEYRLLKNAPLLYATANETGGTLFTSLGPFRQLGAILEKVQCVHSPVTVRTKRNGVFYRIRPFIGEMNNVMTFEVWPLLSVEGRSFTAEIAIPIRLQLYPCDDIGRAVVLYSS
jgi:hypothetical protein